VSDDLGTALRDTWSRQASAAFLLGDPDAPVEQRLAHDPATGVTFRFRWLPHRALRGDPEALRRLGILDPDCRDAALLRDPRDPLGRHCFLCPGNIRVCHPREELVPLEAGGRRWWAGVNFAWLGPHHFTVMANEHVDQVFDDGIVAAMVDLHGTTGFRVLFNPPDAGATIPWHLHLQVTTARFPIEDVVPGREDGYPTTVWRFPAGSEHDAVHRVGEWLAAGDSHRANLLLAGSGDLFAVPRDARRSHASRKGLMGGYEVAGEFVYSDAAHRGDFEAADLDAARAALGEIEPQPLRAGE
jgi:hypothetical protein